MISKCIQYWRRRLFNYHHHAISSARAERIANAAAAGLAPHLPANPRLLDVGCGDGIIARRVADQLDSSRVQGVDILLQPGGHIDASHYDGVRLPHPDHSFDAVLLSDVLHHARRPQTLLEECLRVCRHAVFVKDHFAPSVGAHATLWLMDLAGNASTGVAVTGRYFDRPTWLHMLTRAGARQHQLLCPFIVHDKPWRWLARSHWQFVAIIAPGDAATTDTSAELTPPASHGPVDKPPLANTHAGAGGDEPRKGQTC